MTSEEMGKDPLEPDGKGWMDVRRDTLWQRGGGSSRRTFSISLTNDTWFSLKQ